MSQPVGFEDVRRRVDEFGARATVVTVTPTGAPHVVSAVVEIGDRQLMIRVGGRTRENVVSQPRLTLVWQPVNDGEYQLLLDGTADSVGPPSDDGVSTVAVTVDRGILHRLAELPTAGASCLAL